jgi:hypothetical protein
MDGVRRLVVYGAAAAVVLAAAPSAGAANPTKLSIACTPKALALGDSTTCTATVTDSGPVSARVPPLGVVSFTLEGAGTFDPNDDCALEESGAFSSRCTVTYTPSAIAGGEHTLHGTYDGADGHGRATAQFVLPVTPANDELDAAARLPVPGKVTGTTEGATFNYDDDPDLCSDAYAPVWYELKPAQSERIAVRLTVRGRVDAVVAVFRQDRSKLQDLGCALTDATGVAGVPFDAARGATYLVAVAAPWDARSGTFTIESAVVPPVRFPGVRLGRNADVSLDPLLHPAAAFSVLLHEASTYRIDASAPGACVSVKLLARGATADGAATAKSEGCSGYLVYAPGPGGGGALPLVVSVAEGRTAKVHVALRATEGDDIAPGVPLRSGETRSGRLSAADGDVVDVYRFELGVRGDADLELHGAVPADLLLLDERGKRVACACDGLRSGSLVERLAPGSYFGVVRARPAATGGYALSLRVRVPTSTGLVVKATPAALAAAARVSPPGPGRIVFEIERFDPLTQWHFLRAAARASVEGGAEAPLAPALGGWRVRARYLGTGSRSPSVSGWVAFDVGNRSGGAASAKPRRAVCAAAASGAFPVGRMTVKCAGGGVAATPAPTASAAKTPVRQIDDLKARVEGIALLKDPFRSDLLAALDDARTAIQSATPDDARTSLDEFLRIVQSPPLQAQVPADARGELVAAATKIRRALGS